MATTAGAEHCFAGSWDPAVLLNPSSGADIGRLWPRSAELAMAKRVRDVIAALRAAGWTEVRRRGSHRQFRHPESPWTITVAGKPSAMLAVGTLADIRRKSGLEDLR
jgi:predicted RNA binding protein YcfA (HicA-like mRNA interferase family)